MPKQTEQECCFEQAHHEQQIQQVPIKSKNVLGEANPIYSKKLDSAYIDYDAFVGLKMLPVLQVGDIQGYCCFRLGKRDQVDGKDRKEEVKQEVDNSTIIKIKSLGTQQNAFNKFYEKADIIYCKFNNARYNVYKEITYFGGIFVPRDVLANKIKSICRDDKIIANIGLILNHKQKNGLTVPPAQPTPTKPKPKGCLTFDSNFQSGNLFVAFRTEKTTYDLVLNNDINSKGSTQWFFFSVQGMQPNIDYTFNIVNFTKNDSLFNYGMRPAFYSVLENNGVSPLEGTGEEGKIGWYRFGKNVCYERGQIQRENSVKFYYTLSFTVNWKLGGDKVYLAHSYPYTYTRNQTFLKKLTQKSQRPQQQKPNPRKNKSQKSLHYLQPQKIGKTVSGRQLTAYLISLKKTNKSQSKQVILIMARQHPGETQGSFVCEGIVKELVESSGKEVKFLLEFYQVYVIPMVNPDGVVFGNYRTNLSGKDLNRKWDTQGSNFSMLLAPEVLAVKEFIANLVKNGMSIRFVLDLHGHSKKLNSFFYGNPNPQNPQLSKIFPYICSRYSEAIQFMDCTFASQANKKKAARIYLSTLYQQLHVYTFESSFYGYKNRQGKTVEFTPLEYEKVGQVLIKGLYLLLFKQKNEMPPDSNSIQSIKPIQQNPQVKQSIQIYKKFQSQLKQNQLLLKVGDAESSGSQSKPEQGELNNEQIQYESDEQRPQDDRVIVSSKIPTKANSLLQKQKQQITKNKSIRINSKKTIHQNTVEYKQYSKFRNKKFITISQVNGVLADKYHISLLPIQRVAYKIGKKVDVQVQTQKQDKLAIRIYKQFQIQERMGLAGGLTFFAEECPDDDSSSVSTTFMLKSHSKSTQPKKHAEIVAEIEKNSRHMNFKSGAETEKDLINRRKVSQIIIKQPISKEKGSRKREVFTQTLASFKNQPNRDARFLNPIDTPNNFSIVSRDPENEYRIAQMEKINREVLRIYSKKSTVIELGIKGKAQKSSQKGQKQVSVQKKQFNFYNRY